MLTPPSISCEDSDSKNVRRFLKVMDSLHDKKTDTFYFLRLKKDPATHTLTCYKAEKGKITGIYKIDNFIKKFLEKHQDLFFSIPYENKIAALQTLHHHPAYSYLSCAVRLEVLINALKLDQGKSETRTSPLISSCRPSPSPSANVQSFEPDMVITLNCLNGTLLKRSRQFPLESQKVISRYACSHRPETQNIPFPKEAVEFFLAAASSESRPEMPSSAIHQSSSSPLHNSPISLIQLLWLFELSHFFNATGLYNKCERTFNIFFLEKESNILSAWLELQKLPIVPSVGLIDFLCSKQALHWNRLLRSPLKKDLAQSFVNSLQHFKRRGHIAIHTDIDCLIGLCHEHGQGYEKDISIAVSCYTQASKLPLAKYQLALLHFNGIEGILQKNHSGAMLLLQQAGAIGLKAAQFAHAIHLLNSPFYNKAELINYLHFLADNDYLLGFVLGSLYMEGTYPLPKDCYQASLLFGRLAFMSNDTFALLPDLPGSSP